ncbi:MAG: YHS domain-containing protein [Acidobacteria bacterium]|nr:YHS domain-containing protein [Acidobacteriota bacterium]
MAFLLRLLVWALAFYAAWKWLRGLFQRWIQADPRFRVRSTQRDQPPLSGHMHKDPVCGMYVADESAISQKHLGTLYYFCSSECREKFISQGR